DGNWTLTYLAKSGEDPNKMGVIVPQVPQLIVADGLQYVTFKGITFSHDNWFPGPEGLGDFQGGPRVPGALSFADSSHITFDSGIVNHIQAWGIDFAGASNYNQVVNSALYDVGYGMVRIGKRTTPQDSEDSVPGFTTIENNVMAGGGRIIPSGIGTGVWSGNAHNNVITHNDMYDFYNGAIRVGFKLNITDGVGNAHDNMVSFNRVWQLGQGVTSDMAGIYLANSNTKGNQVLNNVIHDVVHDPRPAGYGGEGVYFDQGGSNILAEDKFVYRGAQAGIVHQFRRPYRRRHSAEQPDHEQHLRFYQKACAAAGRRKPHDLQLHTQHRLLEPGNDPGESREMELHGRLSQPVPTGLQPVLEPER